MKPLFINKFFPVFFSFILISILLIIFSQSLKAAGLNIGFLITANTILFLLTSLAFFIMTKGVKSTNTHAFIRGVYSSLLMKMFVIVVALLVYILLLGGKVDTASLFTTLAFYLVYTSVEVIQLMKIARNKTDA